VQKFASAVIGSIEFHELTVQIKDILMSDSGCREIAVK
jgi:hypothetical protein